MHTLPPEKSVPAAINTLCPDAAFRSRAIPLHHILIRKDYVYETMFISAVGRSCVLHAQPIAAFRRRYLEPEHINGNSAYTVTFNSDDLVKKSVAALDEKLHVPEVEFVDLQQGRRQV